MALPASNRLRDEKIFKEVFRNGKTLRGSFLLIKFLPNQNLIPRIGVLISSKVVGGAVVRNHLRRLITESLRPVLPKLGRYDIVVKVLQNTERDKLLSELGRLMTALYYEKDVN